jgi:hypothetical protein
VHVRVWLQPAGQKTQQVFAGLDRMTETCDWMSHGLSQDMAEGVTWQLKISQLVACLELFVPCISRHTWLREHQEGV